MLVYNRSNADVFKSYNANYKENTKHFVIGNSAEKFAQSVADVFKNIEKPTVLEVGCGQGYYLDYFRQQLIQKRGADCATPYFMGMDGSEVAISQCDSAFPDMSWVCDKIQDFVRDHDERLGSIRYSLILDKSGTTFISSDQEARRILNAFKALIQPGGGYAFIISKDFYENKMRPRIYSKWTDDWISLAKLTWENSYDLSDSHYYRFIFSDGPLVMPA